MGSLARHIVDEINKLMSNGVVVWVEGPPASGKTILIREVSAMLLKSNPGMKIHHTIAEDNHVLGEVNPTEVHFLESNRTDPNLRGLPSSAQYGMITVKYGGVCQSIETFHGYSRNATFSINVRSFCNNIIKPSLH
jgi:ABC-type polar amino acid transport system ATPase subunit